MSAYDRELLRQARGDLAPVINHDLDAAIVTAAEQQLLYAARREDGLSAEQVRNLAVEYLSEQVAAYRTQREREDAEDAVGPDFDPTDDDLQHVPYAQIGLRP